MTLLDNWNKEHVDSQWVYTPWVYMANMVAIYEDVVFPEGLGR